MSAATRDVLDFIIEDILNNCFQIVNEKRSYSRRKTVLQKSLFKVCEECEVISPHNFPSKSHDCVYQTIPAAIFRDTLGQVDWELAEERRNSEEGCRKSADEARILGMEEQISDNVTLTRTAGDGECCFAPARASPASAGTDRAVQNNGDCKTGRTRGVNEDVKMQRRFSLSHWLLAPNKQCLPMPYTNGYFVCLNLRRRIVPIQNKGPWIHNFR